MRVLIVTQYFPPEMGAPQARLSELGERLINRGWEVEALTALPNYPGGRVFDGYAPRRTRVETVGRIRTVRVPLWPSKGGFAKRLITYFSFVASACWHGPRMCARPDLLFVESPPLFIGYAARYLSWRFGCPYVFNVSDLWPETAIRIGAVKPGLMTRLAERLEAKLYRKAAAVTGQSTEIIDGVLRRAPGAKTAVITNGVDPKRFGPEMADSGARALLGDEPGPIFTYAGILGHCQHLDQVLDLAKSLPASVPGRVVLIGEGPEREQLAARIEREGIDRVRLVPAQPRDRIPALLGASDVALVCLATDIPGAVPSKLYEAMASSLPILLLADGEAARRVRDAQCGICEPPNDAAGAQAAFSKLATDASLRAELGQAGRQAAESLYHRDRIADRLDAFLREVLASAGRAA